MTEPIDFKQLEIDGLSFGDGHVTIGGFAEEEEDLAIRNFFDRVDAVESAVGQELDGLSGEAFGNLTPKELSNLVKDALADIKFDDDGRYDGEMGAAAPNGKPLSHGDPNLPDF